MRTFSVLLLLFTAIGCTNVRKQLDNIEYPMKGYHNSEHDETVAIRKLAQYRYNLATLRAKYEFFSQYPEVKRELALMNKAVPAGAVLSKATTAGDVLDAANDDLGETPKKIAKAVTRAAGNAVETFMGMDPSTLIGTGTGVGGGMTLIAVLWGMWSRYRKRKEEEERREREERQRINRHREERDHRARLETAVITNGVYKPQGDDNDIGV